MTVDPAAAASVQNRDTNSAAGSQLIGHPLDRPGSRRCSVLTHFPVASV